MRISKQSTANTLEMLEGVKAEIARVQVNLPDHMELVASSDDSLFIREAINAVYQTIGVTTMLVSIVILAFLGTLRTMLIPAITIPGVPGRPRSSRWPPSVIPSISSPCSHWFCASAWWWTMRSWCSRTSIAVSNKVKPPLLAAYNGARQVAFAVIATTAVLVAVFTPIIFLQDNMGVIFRELAVTISAAVIFSSVLALSLTPVMCAKAAHRQDTRQCLHPPGGSKLHPLRSLLSDPAASLS